MRGASASFRRGPALGQRSIVLLLLLYGIALGGWSVVRADDAVRDDLTLMDSRLAGVTSAIRTVETGGPPLLACPNGYEKASVGTTCFPAGTTDDQGIYLYLPYFAELAGIEDAKLALKWFYILLFAVLFAALPLVFWGLFDSLLAGSLIPALALQRLRFTEDTDIYWIGVWATVLLLPLVMLAYKRWGPRAPLALVGIALLASFASSIRSHAGLPVLLGALVVLLLRQSSWARRAVTAGAVVLAYLSIAPLGMELTRDYRDGVVDDSTLSERYPSGHPFWHAAYLGLGYIPNDYGLVWNDSVAAAAAERVHPGAVYLSPEYEGALRSEFFRIAREDPGFVARNFAAKLGEILAEAKDRFGLVLLLLPLSLAVGSGRRLMRRYALIAAAAVPISALPPMITLPTTSYSMSWLGLWALFLFLTMAWWITYLARDVRQWLEARGWRHWTERRARPMPRSGHVIRALAIAAPLLLVTAYTAWALPRLEPNDAEAFYRAQASGRVPPAKPDSVASWSFRGNLPQGWSVISADDVDPGPSGSNVLTGTGQFEYQVGGPNIVLPPGKYEARASADVLYGGIELGVLDVANEKWAGTSHYWSGQAASAGSEMMTPFTLMTRQPVRVLLSNWRPSSGASKWTIRRVWIRQA